MNWWLYLVLTIDPRDFWTRWAAFSEAGERWDHGLRRALERSAGKLAYLQTWETHRSGWPHVNVIVGGVRVREWVEGYGRASHDRYACDALGRERLALFPRRWRNDWLAKWAPHYGFGLRVWAEVLEAPGESMAAYLVKLARELTGAASKKGDQSPTHAPRHFRRIRASRGLLPPMNKPSGDWTGRLVPHLWATPTPARAPGDPIRCEDATWDEVLDALGLANDDPRHEQVEAQTGECRDAARGSGEDESGGI